MGKNHITYKDTTEFQSQGICEKIFKAVIISRRISISPQNHKFATTNLATNPKIDHHRNYTAKPIMSKPVAQIPSLEEYQNQVPVEYNHSSGGNAILRFKAESLKGVNKSSVKNMFTVVHHQINEGHKNDINSNDKFSNYIDHVKNKMRTMSSFDDDDKVSHYIAGGDQGAA